MVSILRPMRVKLPEESVEYSLGEQVLVSLIPGQEPVQGVIAEKLGKFLYVIKSPYIKCPGKLCLNSGSLRKYPQK